MFVVRRVVGESMLPGLRPGQIVVASRFGKIRPGSVVILRHDGLEKIKRVAQMEDGTIFVAGDNPTASTDSRQFGWLPQAAVVARVVLPIRPAVRAPV